MEGLLEDFARIRTASPALHNIKIGDLVTATLRYRAVHDDTVKGVSQILHV
jgi:hypothetical protein